MEILFRSNDCHANKICSHYPMFTRTLYYCLVLYVYNYKFFISILTLGHSFKDGNPLTGLRKTLVRFAISNVSWIIILIEGIRRNFINAEADYSKYLGPNYK